MATASRHGRLSPALAPARARRARAPRGVVVGASVALVLPLLLLAAPVARAEPYFAQREGLKCGACHINGTGGGQRTAFGHQYARTYLTMFASAPPRAVAAMLAKGTRRRGGGAMIDPQLNKYISVGANLRVSHSTTFAEKTRHTFDNREANFYVSLRVARPLLLYTDISVAGGNVEAREAFGLLRLGRWQLKAGFFLLPYGLRIWGDEEYIRAKTGYNFSAPDLGVELAYQGDVLSAFLAASNGSGGSQDLDNYKKLSLLVEASWRLVRVGVSGAFNRSEQSAVFLSGLYLGLTLGRLTLLGEADLITTRFDAGGGNPSDTLFALTAYAEANLLLWRGLNLKVAYGYYDPALDRAEDQAFNLRAGIEAFPLPMIAVTAFYTLRQSIPQDEVGNADTVIVELHLYF